MALCVQLDRDELWLNEKSRTCTLRIMVNVKDTRVINGSVSVHGKYRSSPHAPVARIFNETFNRHCFPIKSKATAYSVALERSVTKKSRPINC